MCCRIENMTQKEKRSPFVWTIFRKRFKYKNTPFKGGVLYSNEVSYGRILTIIPRTLLFRLKFNS